MYNRLQAKSWTFVVNLKQQQRLSHSKPNTEELHTPQKPEMLNYFHHGITREDPTVKRLLTGILEGKRASLAEGITLVETVHPRKKAQAQVRVT